MKIPKDANVHEWTWPFNEYQIAMLTNVPCSVDGQQDAFLFGPYAPTCLGMFGPSWADGFADSEPGDVWHILFTRMSLDDIANLPEFTGF
jgi:hypothetical protein